MMIRNKTRNVVLASLVKIADNPFTRIRGLLHKACLLKGEALMIKPCNSIHMFFMRFPIDVVFVDKNDTVVGIVENIQPFGLSPIFWKAQYAIELPARIIQSTQTALGDVLEMVALNPIK